MHVTVRLFAVLRERAGAARRELDLPDGARVGDVWAALGLGQEPPGLAYARNRTYGERAAALGGGEGAAVTPPVSGGASGTEAGVWAAISDEPVDLAPLLERVSDHGAGA